MSGYKLILDLYEHRSILNIDFSNVFGSNTSSIVSIFLNPLTLLLLLVMLFVFVIMYLQSRIRINAIFINVLLIAVYVLFSMPTKKVRWRFVSIIHTLQFTNNDNSTITNNDDGNYSYIEK